MARDLTTYRQVTEVVPDQSGNIAMEGVASAGQDVIKTSQEAKITENFSKAQMDLNAQKYQIQNEYEDKPFEGVKAFKDKRDEVMSTYGEQISPFFQGVWQHQARAFGIQDDAAMQSWAFDQTKKNTVTSINSAMQNNYQQANLDGRKFGSGEINDLDAILNFVPSKQSLQSFGMSNLGETKTSALTKDYDKNYVKSLLSGVAETNPAKAAELLDSDQFKDKFTTAERGDMAALIEKTQKQMELIGSLQKTQNTQQVIDLVNNPQETYLNKRQTIDQLELTGGVNATTAANARRALTSKEAVDAVTHTPTMSGIVQKIYDLNSQQGMDNAEYLKGIQNIHDEILTQQANGKLNQTDVVKMNNEVKTLTSKRVADATKSVGNDMYDATQKFNVLPPEYRGEATRQLFYMTNGKQNDLSDDQYKNLTMTSANTVIDNINKQRRANALKVVGASSDMLSNNEFMSKYKITQDQIDTTAKNRGLSKDEVIRRLRDKLEKKQ